MWMVSSFPLEPRTTGCACAIELFGSVSTIMFLRDAPKWTGVTETRKRALHVRGQGVRRGNASTFWIVPFSRQRGRLKIGSSSSTAVS
jgi:hypothetical protein